VEKAELRPLILEILRKNPQTHTNAIEHQVKALVEDYDRHDALKLQEVVWELLVQGILAPGKNSSNLHLPFVHVTDYGTRVLEEDSFLLHDPDGYLERLVSRLPQPVDAILLCFVREGLASFLVGRHLGTVVALGLAGERGLDLLVAALAHGLRDKRDRAALRRAVKQAGRSVERRCDAIVPYLRALSLPQPLRDVLRVDFPNLVTLLRLTRDPDGLPVESSVDRDTAHAALLIFPGVAERLFALMEYLASPRG
jgi:hypothetical protein